ncbi:glycosyltransferase, partial [bacterium]|nr:glycosyltransferase [Candidatus Elulimicrobium humile]
YSIVIPTYNHLDDCLRPCLESIIKYTDLDNVEVIVIANGCRDSTVPYVNSLGKPFKCIEHKEQLGYTKATNIGMRVACGDYIILLNNDTVFLPQQKNEWLAILEKPFLIDPQAGMSGPMLFKGVPGKSNDFIMFFCAMTTRKVVDNIGYLDEMYSPGGVEDVDYGLRLTIGGYKLYSVATSRCVEAKDAHHMSFGSFPIYHPGGTTCSKEPGWNDILIRNNRLLAQKFPEYFTGLDWINELEKQTKRKIYDCFPFFNEFEILEIRLAELYDIVDKFIIIEASKTHSGRDKPLYLRENIAKFAKYQDKIVIHTVDFPANLQDAWSRERSQRDAIMDILRP